MENLKIENETLVQLRGIVEALDDKKANRLRVFDLRGKSSVTDFMIIATGTSNPHLRAIRDSLHQYLKDAKIPLIGAEREAETGWVVVDAFDIMVHLQTQEMREYYGLEFLWKDAVELEGFVKQIAAGQRG